MSAFIPLVKYVWCKLMSGFWGKVAEITSFK